jgi:peptide/nickel transport system permease protein
MATIEEGTDLLTRETLSDRDLATFPRWRRRTIRAARRYPVGFAGGVVLVLFALAAVCAPWITPHDPLVQDIPNKLASPSGQYLWGADNFGRDVLSRVIYGARVSMYVGFVSVGLATFIGTPLGVASGYLGGIADLVIQRFVDMFLGFPGLILAMVMVVALGASLNNVALAIGVVFLPRVVRLARASALTVKEEPYILAALATGAGSLRIMLKHVLPNSLAPVFVLATGYLGTAMVVEASLSFLGLGVPPPDPSWGSMIRAGASGNLEGAPWLSMYPGLALAVVVFSVSFLGDALRDALDPRLRGR